MKSFAALAILAATAAAYPSDVATSCGGYTCPKGWAPQLDNGMTVCAGPCTPTDCCDKLPTVPQPPVYTPPTYVPAPAPASKCVPLRTGDGNQCAIKTGFDTTLRESTLSVGSCTDPRVVTFCGCELKTADNQCLTSTQSSGVEGAPLVLKDCGKCSGKGMAWQYLSDGQDYYMKNGFDKYISYDGKTLVQSNDAGFFYLEQPCAARLDGNVAPPAPIPTPLPLPPRPRPEPVRSCGAYQCPPGWMKDPVDAGMTMCVLDPVNGCTVQECCVRKARN